MEAVIRRVFQHKAYSGAKLSEPLLSLSEKVRLTTVKETQIETF